MRARAISECEDIQNGADDYADQMLDNIEHKLSDMLRVVRNGRDRLDNVSGSWIDRPKEGRAFRPTPQENSLFVEQASCLFLIMSNGNLCFNYNQKCVKQSYIV